jgi:hypothetical protein
VYLGLAPGLGVLDLERLRALIGTVCHGLKGECEGMGEGADGVFESEGERWLRGLPGMEPLGLSCTRVLRGLSGLWKSE